MSKRLSSGRNGSGRVRDAYVSSNAIVGRVRHASGPCPLSFLPLWDADAAARGAPPQRKQRRRAADIQLGRRSDLAQRASTRPEGQTKPGRGWFVLPPSVRHVNCAADCRGG
eukprot:gene25685-biopygen24006